MLISRSWISLSYKKEQQMRKKLEKEKKRLLTEDINFYLEV